MEMKEAARTSILSKRWRCLWAKRTHLDFNPLCVLPARDNDIRIGFTVSEKDEYINWVNQVVGLHCSPCIDTFRVRFDKFDSRDAHHFDKWVKFAISKKVKTLELNARLPGVFYTLGFGILQPSVDIRDSGITSLTSLHLNRVDVSGDFIEFLLSKCHHLEGLYIGYSDLLVRLKVIGLACKLKHLALHCCGMLEELEIDAQNLMYFGYINMGRNANLVLSMPMLVEAAFAGACFESPVSIFQQISPFAANISKLSLNMECGKFPAGAIPTFCNLKQLNMVVQYSGSDLVDITRFLEACPVLHELKLEVFWFIYYESGIEAFELVITDLLDGNDLEVELDYRKLRQTEPNIHPSLKQVEIAGFGGTSYDVDIIIYIMRSAWNLETILCDPHRSRDYMYDTYDDIVVTSRARAYKLAKIIPPKISLVVV